MVMFSVLLGSSGSWATNADDRRTKHCKKEHSQALEYVVAAARLLEGQTGGSWGGGDRQRVVYWAY